MTVRNAFHYSHRGGRRHRHLFPPLVAQLEDRQIDVETTHGNLPKVGLSYLWNPHYLTSVSYSYSVSGNLGTTSDGGAHRPLWRHVNLLAGGAYGPVAPAIILNFQSGLEFVAPGIAQRRLCRASKPLPHQRGELTLVADYQDLSGIKRFTLTLTYIFHLGHAGTAP